MSDGAVLEVENLVKHFGVRGSGKRGLGSVVRAVDGVSFSIAPEETMGLVGESGCGKSTVARTVVRLLEPTDGSIRLNGVDISTLDRRRMKPHRRDMQIVFQDPFSAVNPRMSVYQIVSEPIRIHTQNRESEIRDEVADLLESVGLNSSYSSRFPRHLSGGQRQRLLIARALALRPRLLVLDEPVSALDVSIQAQVINLLQDLKQQFRLSVLFISHDLSVVHYLCDRIAVMYLGQIVEMGTKEEIFSRPTHPYTQALLSAVPVPVPKSHQDRKRIVLHGEIPSPSDPPSGCRFRTRCWKAEPRCAEEEPALVIREAADHPSACHFADLRT